MHGRTDRRREDGRSQGADHRGADHAGVGEPEQRGAHVVVGLVLHDAGRRALGVHGGRSGEQRAGAGPTAPSVTRRPRPARRPAAGHPARTRPQAVEPHRDSDGAARAPNPSAPLATPYAVSGVHQPVQEPRAISTRVTPAAASTRLSNDIEDERPSDG